MTEQAERDARFPDAASDKDREFEEDQQPTLVPGVAGGVPGGVVELTEDESEPRQAEEFRRRNDELAKRGSNELILNEE